MPGFNRRQFVGTAAAFALSGCNPAVGRLPARNKENLLAETARMLSPRATHAAVGHTDGTVTILGGFAKEGVGLTMIERFDPRRGAFSSIGELTKPRIQPLAVRMAGDRILVMGGEWESARSTAELIDRNGKAKPMGTLNDRRTAAAVIRLRDGRLLVSGGSRPDNRMIASAEIYLPDTGRFVPISPMREARAGHVMSLLSNGKVLVTGGGEGGRISRTAEIFDPETLRFTSTGSMASARYKHAAAVLKTGEVLILGGSDDRSGSDGRGRLAACEFFDHVAGTFTTGPTMHAPRHKIGDAIAVLPNGTIVVAGGATEPEYYDPNARHFVASESRYDERRDFVTATAFEDNQVLAAGGYNSNIEASDRAWILVPALL